MKKILIFILCMIALFWLLNYLYPLNTDRLNKPKSTLIYDRDGRLISLKLSSDGYLRIPMDEKIPARVKSILLAYEDQYFEYHFGINPLSIARALWANLSNSRKIGASTITMQVARMMHHESRTLSQKLIEMFISLQLESRYTKQEILKFYLDNAPYGGNVEGFASASFRYFDTEPSALSLSQIAYLTAIPKNPNSNRPRKDRDINGIKNRLLDRLYKQELISKKDYLRAKDENISVNISNLPKQIPHIRAQIDTQGEIYTTIDIVLQQKIEHLLKDDTKKLEEFGIYNGVALVIDNHNMQILAYVGSNDFYDTRHGGQNDGIRALVSPGSTLKPLVYAKALEQGLTTPLKKVYDIPLSISGYQPTNYAKEYLGEVTATEALQRSLNIPAVELDRLLGDESLYSLLYSSGISSLVHQKSYYGSSLVLGGWGLTLRENAELFAMMANRGVYQKSSYLLGVDNNKTQILTPQSTYIISNILADAPRLHFSSYWEYMDDMPRIAFKTGTSAHARDMLTLGYTPNYTVAVWYGNFSGKVSKISKRKRATGLKVASPTMFKIFSMLGKQSWYSRPSGISRKKICQDAIELTGCKEYVIDETIDTVSLGTPCHAMRGEVLAYLIKQHKIEEFGSLEAHECYSQWREYKPLVTSPVEHKKYIYNRLLPKNLKKTKLECYSFESNSTIYWLIDDKPPIVANSSVPIYRYLGPDDHRVSCLDEGSKMKSVDIEIQEW